MGATATLSGRRLWVAFSVVMLTTFLAALDQTIVATALPRIVDDLNGFDHLSWVVTAYLLASTVTVPLYGRLSDVYGRRPLFIVSISLFLAGSVLCGAARSMEWLIAARAVQGLGAGGLLPLGQTAVADLFSPRERGRFQGFIGGAWAAAAVAGPLIGGMLTDYASWRWIFYVNIPLAVLALVVVIRTLPATAVRQRQRIDYAGAALLSLAVTGILLACVWGGATYAWTSPEVVTAAIGGALLLVAFVVWERRIADPLVPFALFSNRVFAVSCSANLTFGALIFGTSIYVPLFVQEVLGASATSSGVILMPLLLSWVAMSIVAGMAVVRTGRYRALPLIGAALVIVAAVILAQVDASTSRAAITIALAVLGLGMGAGVQIYVIATQNAVAAHSVGIATSGLQFFRSIGGSVAVAVFGTIVASGADVPGRVGSGSQAELASSLQDVFALLVPLALVTLVVAALLPELPLRRSSAAQDLA